MFGGWQRFVDTLVYERMGLSPDSALGSALDFFLFDTIKILLLLTVIVFAITFVRSFFPTEKVREWLEGKHPFTGYVAAALFGIVTPFCSCSAIPLFLGFIQARIPLGVTFSYLVSAPMNNEIAIAMLFSLFGWKITLLYIGMGLLVAILAGILIDRLDMEDELLVKPPPAKPPHFEEPPIPLKERLREAWDATWEILRKVGLYVLLGVGVGAFIHGYVPAELIARYAGGDAWYAVPLATLLGVPMYSNAAGVMPLIEVLTSKGMFLGTALSFMMAITALSLPEAMILKKILSTKLIAIFFGIVTAGIMMTGWVFNALLG
ncbi:permease [Nitratifractor sp.]